MIEIERKFLVTSDAWRTQATSAQHMMQGYLGGEHCSVRLRIAGDQAWLNIKSRELGVQRQEFEYPVPVMEAKTMLQGFAISAIVEKTRHLVPVGQHTFEVDEFMGDNQGLIVAEVELNHPDEVFEHPDWLGQEVTNDVRYYNTELSIKPYSAW